MSLNSNLDLCKCRHIFAEIYISYELVYEISKCYGITKGTKEDFVKLKKPHDKEGVKPKKKSTCKTCKY